ncbi:MAG TPA: LysM peptidoglycan-binding domain-containing protein, partial [Flavobacteriia bacterium]|nr:LysM peptidoglycan-binding domain-containing protein [Flavobacteriia bacterium]
MNRLNFLVVLFFLATIAVFSQNKKHIPYTVLKGETVESICRKLTITPYTLLQLNPDIKEGLTEGQLIIVPNKEYKPELDTQVEGDYVKDGFLYHKVLPKENYYRLRKQFGVAKRILRKHNLALRTGNLKAGQIIKIPIKAGAKMAAIATPETKDTKPYLVRPKETKYSIATRYGITVEKLESLNPDLKGTVLKMATIINVPNTEAIPDANDDFMTHQVEKGETLFGLSQQFKISQEELITLNPDLEDGVKEGMLIRIPKTTLGANTSIFVPNIPENTHLKIAMMLPFMSNKSISFDSNAEDKKKRKAAKRLNRVTDFYLGAMIALDSIKKQGVSVSVNVFDTENSIATISSILKNNRFDDVDAIVGPMFLNNVKFVSQGLRIDSLAIISPASSKDHSVFASKSMVKEVPSDELLANKVLDYIKRNYTGQHLIVIADDEKENAPRVNRIVATLNTLDSVQKVAVLKPEKGYIKLDLFKEAIQEKKENWFILITKDDV